jgi:AraC-like DNA-binding protein
MAKSASFVRAAVLIGYAEVARSVGLDPGRMLKDAGLHRVKLDNPDALIPASPVLALLEASAAAAHVEDFGLRLATKRQLAHVGPIGLLLREEPTVRHAIKALERHFLLYNETLAFRLDERHGTATLRTQLALPAAGDTRQAAELVVGMAFRTMKALAGAAFAPEQISFAHAAPAGRTLHSSFFRARVQFDDGFDGIILRTSDLDAPILTADATMARYVKQYLEGTITRPTASIDASVRQLVLALLPSGRCTSELVARHLGVDRRTVHRRLEWKGETFMKIVNDVRCELARRHIATERRSLTETAGLLGFGSLSAFSRWFKTEFGTNPASWRHASPLRARPSRKEQRPRRRGATR